MGGDDVSRVYSEKKVAYVERLEGYLANLPRVLLINADNVGSQQMHIVRAELRKDGQKAEILMGKNTMMKFVIRRAANNKPVYVACSFDRSCIHLVNFETKIFILYVTRACTLFSLPLLRFDV